MKWAYNAFVILALLSSQSYPASSAPATAANTTASIWKTDKITSKTLVRGCDVDLQYPQLKGTSPEDKKVNALIKSVIDKKLANVKDGFAKADITPPPGYPKNARSYCLSRAESTFKDKDIVSVKLRYEEYGVGAAHPNHTAAVINCQLSTGKQINLKTLFGKNESKALKFVSDRCISTIKKTWGPDPDMEWISKGACPSDKCLGLFTLNNKGVTFIFNEYTVAPYVAGEQTVTIPYKDLKAFMDTSSPSYALASN